MIRDISKRVIENWIAGFRNENVQQLSSLFAENAVFHDPRFPVLRGLKTITGYYHHLLSETTAWGATMFEGPYLHGDDCFAIQSNLLFTWRENGVIVPWPFVAFFKVDLTSGKVTRYNEYWDTQDTLRKIGIRDWGPLPDFALENSEAIERN
jgi:SnoaL-like domain